MYITRSWDKHITPQMCESNIYCMGGPGTGKSFLVARKYLESAIDQGFPCFWYTENKVEDEYDTVQRAVTNGYEVISCNINEGSKVLKCFSVDALEEYRHKKVLLILSSWAMAVSRNKAAVQIGAAIETVIWERVFATWGKPAEEGSVPARIVLDGVSSLRIMAISHLDDNCNTRICLTMQPLLVFEMSLIERRARASLDASNDTIEEVSIDDDQIAQRLDEISYFLSPYDYFLSLGFNGDPDLQLMLLANTLFQEWEIEYEEILGAIGEPPFQWMIEPYCIGRETENGLPRQ